MRRSFSEPGFADLARLRRHCDQTAWGLEAARKRLRATAAVPLVTGGGPALPAALLLIGLSSAAFFFA